MSLTLLVGVLVPLGVQCVVGEVGELGQLRQQHLQLLGAVHTQARRQAGTTSSDTGPRHCPHTAPTPTWLPWSTECGGSQSACHLCGRADDAVAASLSPAEELDVGLLVDEAPGPSPAHVRVTRRTAVHRRLQDHAQQQSRPGEGGRAGPTWAMPAGGAAAV